MDRGGKLLVAAAVLAIAGCSSEPGRVDVRSLPAPLAAGEHPASFRVAEARGQLALGNVGLALESFRKAHRENPSSTQALHGMAECYDRMGRFDLARRHLEEALALAPGDTALLEALALSLDRAGKLAEAASIRGEIAQRLAAAAPAAEGAVMAQAPLPVSTISIEIPSQTGIGTDGVEQVVLPAAAPTPAPAAIEVPVQAAIAVAQKATLAVPALQIAVVAAAETVRQPAAADMAQPAAAQAEPARSVTIKLPAPKPAALDAGQQAASRRLADRNGPRLERLSMGEVALVTVAGPIWKEETVSSTARSTTVRFVPLQPSEMVAEIRLLNAARVHKLAARTRAYLRGRGWRSIAIGDADSTRAQSIVLYPEGQRPVASKLARQFGFALAPRADVPEVTVLLGRDSVRIAGARAGG